MFLFRTLGFVSESESKMTQSNMRALGDFIRRESGIKQPINRRYLSDTDFDFEEAMCNMDGSVVNRRATILAKIGVNGNTKVNLRKVDRIESAIDDDWHHISNSDLESESDSGLESDSEIDDSNRVLTLESQITALKRQITKLEKENRSLSAAIQKNVKKQPRSKAYLPKHFVDAIAKFQKQRLNKVTQSEKINSLQSTYVMIPNAHKFAALNVELANKVKNPSLKRVKHILESRKIVDPHREYILKIEAEMSKTKMQLRSVHPSVPTILVLE